MSDLQSEVAALRREVAELRAGLEALRSQEQHPPASDGERASQKLKEDLARSGKPAGIAVLEGVVLQRGQDSCTASGGQKIWTSADDLPSAQKLIDMITGLASEPLALRAMYKLVERFFEGGPRHKRPDEQMILPKAELAVALDIGETDLEKALLPLVANETLRWSKTATGEECYGFVRSDTFLHLLALAHQ
jgi:hypothetical protein